MPTTTVMNVYKHKSPHGRRRRRATVAAAVITLATAVTAGLLGPLGTAPSAHAEISDGLLLRYKLDETSGTVAHDSSGNGRDGTVNGGVTWDGDQGLSFNGSDTYLKATT